MFDWQWIYKTYLGKFGYIEDRLLDLREEGGHLLELFQLEQGVARSVLEQHEVGRHVSVIYSEIKYIAYLFVTHL